MANITEEQPIIAAHIFEGHLYTKDDATSKWLWRLFRFDGTSLTCLSSKKNKLPPHTSLDSPFNSHCPSSSHRRPVSSLAQSKSTHSFTSPILATPKHKTDRILAGSYSITETTTQDNNNNSNRNAQPIISASYYQLPKWTVDMINIYSISLLKPKLKKSTPFKYGFTASASNSKSFMIRTFDGACYTLKASKQHDLERWIFVLAKMWTFAKATRQIYGDSIVPQLNHNTALVDSGSNDGQMTSPTQRNQSSMRASTVGHVGHQKSSSQQHDTMLSTEKELWIDTWVNSLIHADSYTDVVDMNTHPPHAIPLKRTASRRHQQMGNDVQSSSRPQQTRNHSSNKQSQTTPSNASNSSARIPTKNWPAATQSNFDYKSYFRDVNAVYTNKVPKQSLTYHDTVRARPVQFYTTAHDIPVSMSAVILSHHPQVLSPLDELKFKCRQYESIPSPQATQAVATLGNDEDVCLADVRKSLQMIKIDVMQGEQESIIKRRSAATIDSWPMLQRTKMT